MVHCSQHTYRVHFCCAPRAVQDPLSSRSCSSLLSQAARARARAIPPQTSITHTSLSLHAARPPSKRGGRAPNSQPRTILPPSIPFYSIAISAAQHIQSLVKASLSIRKPSEAAQSIFSIARLSNAAQHVRDLLHLPPRPRHLLRLEARGESPLDRGVQAFFCCFVAGDHGGLPSAVGRDRRLERPGVATQQERETNARFFIQNHNKPGRERERE